MSRNPVLTRGSGVPVLMVHGWAVDHRIMLPLDESFAAHSGGWRRVFVDLLGFGTAAGGPSISHADDIAADLDDLIDREFGGRPFAEVGSSFGAGLARRLAVCRPEQVLGVAMLCPTAEPIPSRRLPEARAVEVAEGLLAGLTDADREQFTAVTTRQTADVWRRFEQYVLPGLRAGNPDVAERIRPALSQSPEAMGPPFLGPVLMMLGRNDTVVGWRNQLDLAEHYPNATVVIADRCGHNIHLEHPVLTHHHLHSWLDTLPV
ncbi:alpha/beta fold hydrolase [Williamsia sp. MIQD14]|uniref:alpha/beta fold hydrolase n=1 Tax=Williamsia sp. MIQD14 TaxID=3425703 RepID=UPI003DA06930